jgi:microcystin-dependent protein
VPYIGEIRLFAGNFAPAGWAFCNGQLIPISENDALFVVLGTTYGGDGQETFALPDLRGRLPIHQGTGPGLSSRILGEAAGVESVTLTVNQIPAHNHALLCTTDNAATAAPQNQVMAAAPDANTNPYNTDAPLTTLASTALSPVGGSQPHTNVQPFLCINYIISLFGIFPSQ